MSIPNSRNASQLCACLALRIYPPDNGQSRRRFRVNGPVPATEDGANLTNVVQTEEGLSLLSKDTQFAQCLFCKYATLALILYSIPQIGSSSYLRVRWRCSSWRPRPPARASPSRPRAGDGRHHHRRCYSSWRSSRSLNTFCNHGCAVDLSTFAFGRWLG